MITNVDQFRKRLLDLIVFRAKNFAVTDCDINTIIDVVYDDIVSEVNIGYVKYPYTVTNDDKIVLPEEEIVQPDPNTPGEITMVYKDVYYICDENDYSLENVLIKSDRNVYIFKNSMFRDEHIGDVIYFFRSVIPSIDLLAPELYNTLSPVMVEGIMYHIQASIPDTADGQIIMLAKKRYDDAKTKLKNSIPQVVYLPQKYKDRR